MKNFIFVHFPKASGPSIRVQMERQLGDRLLLDYDHDPVGGDNAFEASPPLPPGVTGVVGHFRPDRYASETNRALVTALREPVDNLISIDFFWERYPPGTSRTHDDFLANQPSLIEFAAYPAFNALMSQRYFGDSDMSRFDVISFHETRSVDVPVLGKFLGLDLEPEVHLNPTINDLNDQRRETAADIQLRRRLRDIVHEDVGFYEDLVARRA